MAYNASTASRAPENPKSVYYQSDLNAYNSKRHHENNMYYVRGNAHSNNINIFVFCYLIISIFCVIPTFVALLAGSIYSIVTTS